MCLAMLRGKTEIKLLEYQTEILREWVFIFVKGAKNISLLFFIIFHFIMKKRVLK